MVGDAELSVERGPGAEHCPTASDLGRALTESRGDVEGSPKLSIRIAITRESSRLTARIEVTGESSGRRTLSSSEADCVELARQLTAAIALLLDPHEPAAREEPTDEPAPPPPTASAPSPAAPAASAVVVTPAIREQPTGAMPEQPPRLWLFAGAGVTAGASSEPLAWGALGAWFRMRPWAAALHGFATTESSVDYAAGNVNVRLTGGLARGCYGFGAPTNVDALACAAFAVAALHGSAEGYAVNDAAETRPWYAAGGSVVLGGPLGPQLRYALDMSILAPLQYESFSIRNAGVAYVTPSVGFWATLGLGVPIW